MIKALLIILVFTIFSKTTTAQKKIENFTQIKNPIEKEFYIKNTEVTIYEYFEFVDWVIDSISRRLLAEKFPEQFLIKTFNNENILKDTGSWNINWKTKCNWNDEEYFQIIVSALTIPENTRFYKSPAIDYRKIIFKNNNGKNIQIIPSNYRYRIFRNEKTIEYRITSKPKLVKSTQKVNYGTLPIMKEKESFDLNKNKPISNISYIQAQAYCEWKTNQLNKKNKKLNYRCILPKIKHYNMIWGLSKEHEPILKVLPNKQLLKATEIDWHYYHENAKFKDSLNRAKKKKLETKNNREFTSVLDGVYIQEHTKEINLLKEQNIKYQNIFKNSRDYYPVINNKKINGLTDNLSEWINENLKSENLKNYTYSYKDVDIVLADTTNSKLVVGGNWWHGNNRYTKTFVTKNKELETIGFRYVMYLEEKK